MGWLLFSLELYLGGYVNKSAVNVSVCLETFLKKTSTGLRGNNLNNICAGLYEKTQPSTLWFTHRHTHAQHALHTCNSSTHLYVINSDTKDWLPCYLLGLNECITMEATIVYFSQCMLRNALLKTDAVKHNFMFFQQGEKHSLNASRSTSLWQNWSHVTDSLEKLLQPTWGKMVHIFSMEVIVSKLYTKHQLFGLLPLKK